MINCPMCENPCSPQAAFCPKCGHPFVTHARAVRKPREPKPKEPPQASVRHFTTRVAGVTHSNDDGSSRQKILEDCSAGEVIVIAPEPNNRYDRDAWALRRQDGQQIGYLPAGTKSSIATRNGDCRALCVVQSVARAEGGALGMRIAIVIIAPDASDAYADAYVDKLARCFAGGDDPDPDYVNDGLDALRTPVDPAAAEANRQALIAADRAARRSTRRRKSRRSALIILIVIAAVGCAIWLAMKWMPRQPWA
jgi:hypothetical protein